MPRLPAYVRQIGVAILVAATLLGACARGVAAHYGQTSILERPKRSLPLIVMPDADGPGDAFVVLLSGDGGWSRFDRTLARSLTGAGLPVVGWNAQTYFGSPRTPASAADDLQRVIDTYGPRFRRSRVLLVGFSFGANALPFMIERLPAGLRERIAAVALIAPSERAQFHFSPLDWLSPPPQGLAVAPAIARLDPGHTLCAYGLRDRASICPRLPNGAAQTLPRPGGHHLSGGDDAELVRAIVAVAGAS